VASRAGEAEARTNRGTTRHRTGCPSRRRQAQEHPSFTFEEAFVEGDRATARRVFAWTADDGSGGHVRGADVLRIHDGRIVEKLSYVKG
jgi:ketosteroid isomerase-like protein